MSKNQNLVTDLKETGQIDHKVVSFYLNKDMISMLKFGSYDKAALKNPDDFHVFRTVNKNAWRIDTVSVKILGDLVVIIEDQLEISS